MYKLYTVPNLSVLTLTVTVSTIYSEHDTTGQLCLEVFPFIGIVHTIIIVISKYECEQWSMDKVGLPSLVFCDWSETSLLVTLPWNAPIKQACYSLFKIRTTVCMSIVDNRSDMQNLGLVTAEDECRELV